LCCDTPIHRARPEGAEHSRRDESLVLGLGQAVDQAHDGQAQERRARNVDAGLPGPLPVSGHRRQGGGDADHGQGHVDQQHQPPAEGGQPAADSGPERAGHGGGASHGAQGPPALRSLEGAVHDGHTARQHHGAPGALHYARGQEHDKRRGKPANGGACGEQDRSQRSSGGEQARITGGDLIGRVGQPLGKALQPGRGSVAQSVTEGQSGPGPLLDLTVGHAEAERPGCPVDD
jgi:hypothetical protein